MVLFFVAKFQIEKVSSFARQTGKSEIERSFERSRKKIVFDLREGVRNRWSEGGSKKEGIRERKRERRSQIWCEKEKEREKNKILFDLREGVRKWWSEGEKRERE